MELKSEQQSMCTDTCSGHSKTDVFKNANVVVDSTSTLITKLKRRSDAWSRTNTIPMCRLVTDGLKKRQTLAKEKQEAIENLLAEAKDHFEIQHEAHKALTLCEHTGRPSFECAEAERLILLSGIRYFTLMKEAQALVAQKEDLSKYLINSKAILYLNSIALKFTDRFNAKIHSGGDHFFMCILREELTQGIIATQIASVCPVKKMCAVDFSDCITLPNIPSKFKLRLDIYWMEVTSITKHSRKWKLVRALPFSKLSLHSKANKKNEEANVLELACCPSESGNTFSVNMSIESPHTSRFEKVGTVLIDTASLHQRVFPLMDNKGIVESLVVSAHADLESFVFEKSMQGYLSVFLDGWIRKWFVLKGAVLSCWEYPDHPAISEAKPLNEWDLLCADTVSEACEDICAWPCSISIVFKFDRKQDCLLLSAGNYQERDQWMGSLNQVINSIVS